MKTTFLHALLSGFLTLALLTLIFPTDTSFAQTTPPPEYIRNLVLGSGDEGLAAAAPLTQYPWTDVTRAIQTFNDYPEPKIRSGFIPHSWQASDSLNAPYYVFIPLFYEPMQPTPAVFWLHGGVARPEFITRDTSNHASPDDFLDLNVIQMCRDHNWLGVVPMARIDCLWWNRTGMEFLRVILRDLKRHYNIDDDRVVISGFSDGGSGAYHLAFLMPTDYSLFFPYSGHIGVGSYVGGMQVYPFNLTRRPLFPVNGGNDRLYPAPKFLSVMADIISQTGADLTFTVYDTAGHNHGYLSREMNRMAERIANHARHPLSSHIYWECDDLTFGRADWVEITALDTAAPAAEWHRQFNSQLLDDGITIGFMADRAWEGEGVRVASLSGSEDTPARKAGLLEGDVLISFDDITIKDYVGLEAAKATKKRGDAFTMTVLRGEETVTLKSQFPPVGHYDVFNYPRPSAAVEVIRAGNLFDVRASRVTALSLYIHPDMVRLDQPVVVAVDGKEVFNGLLEPDAEFMLKEFLKDRDRKLLWAGRIDVRI